MLEDIVNAGHKIEKKFKSTANVMKNDYEKYSPIVKPIAAGSAVGAGLCSLVYGVSFLPMFLALGIASSLLTLTFYVASKGMKYYFNKFNKLRYAYA